MFFNFSSTYIIQCCTDVLENFTTTKIRFYLRNVHFENNKLVCITIPNRFVWRKWQFFSNMKGGESEISEIQWLQKIHVTVKIGILTSPWFHVCTNWIYTVFHKIFSSIVYSLDNILRGNYESSFNPCLLYGIKFSRISKFIKWHTVHLKK